tara:strand:+ start:172 stop:690 length:519 start_codon:yes stop_codon:yes gene_type:complete
MRKSEYPEPNTVTEQRRFLQQGQAGKKKTRNSNLRNTFKKKYFWISEDLQTLYWSGISKSKGPKLSEAKEKVTLISIANIKKITPAAKLKKTFHIHLHNNPTDHQIYFDALTSELRDKWIACLTKLCSGELNYRLSGDYRDQTTEISIHFRSSDKWHPCTIVGYDEKESKFF